MNKLYKYLGLICLILLFGINVVAAQQLTEEQIIDIAQNEFAKEVPQEYRSEYVFGGIRKTVLGTVHDNSYTVSWGRLVDGIPVRGDRFFVIVDSASGNVVDTTLYYSGPVSEIDTSYTISKDQAKWLVETAYNGKLADWSSVQSIGNPYLFIVGKKTAWEAVVEFPSTRDSAKIVIDAKTGETIDFSQSEGSSIQQIPTSFNPTQYYLEVYGVYAILVIIIVVGGLFYWKRILIFHKKK